MITNCGSGMDLPMILAGHGQISNDKSMSIKAIHFKEAITELMEIPEEMISKNEDEQALKLNHNTKKSEYPLADIQAFLFAFRINLFYVFDYMN